MALFVEFCIAANGAISGSARKFRHQPKATENVLPGTWMRTAAQPFAPMLYQEPQPMRLMADDGDIRMCRKKLRQ
jgi:hypothetical protein